MKFYKYHALGNDYIVVDSREERVINTELVKLICHRHFGVGSDGVLYGPSLAGVNGIGLKIFNPDGSEAEKSGNGLRIFSRYLFDKGDVKENEAFKIITKGGIVSSIVSKAGKEVEVEMGRVSFDADTIPVTGFSQDVLEKTLTLKNKEFIFSAATIGNPHCVIISQDSSDKELKELALTYGKEIENHKIFPNRTNVQFVKVLDKNNIRIEIWERGAEYTLASGSSSSAAASVCHKLGLCDNEISVHMPGGVISIKISPSFDITMNGAVTKICSGQLTQE